MELNFICLGAAVLSVQNERIALKLGQTNQLVAVGFLLSVMGSNLRRQSQLLMLTWEAKYGKSTLQNYDAIIRNDTFAPTVEPRWRINLLVLSVCPLAISAAYKQSIGHTTVNMEGNTGENYALVGPPGIAAWVGLPLMANAISDLSKAYPNLDSETKFTYPGWHGYNMYLINVTTTAMLDGPVPDYISSIQASLSTVRSQKITARVNATICSLNTTTLTWDHDAWKTLKTIPDYQYNEASNGININGGVLTNFYSISFLAVSAWDSNNPLTPNFESTARGYNLRRGQCTGVWEITSSKITLIQASDCIAPPNPFSGTQDILNNNIAGLDRFYPPMLLESLRHHTCRIPSLHRGGYGLVPHCRSRWWAYERRQSLI